MNKKIAVLACGWSVHFLKSFIEGMKKEAESNNANPPVLEDANNSEDLTTENEKDEDSALAEDKIDNNEETFCDDFDTENA